MPDKTGRPMAYRGMKLGLVSAIFLSVMVVLVGSFIVEGQSSSNSVKLKLSKRTGLPIIYPYHGMILNHDLEVIPPTAENVLTLFRALSSGLAEVQAPDVQGKLKGLRNQAKSSLEASQEADLALEASLVRWLFERASAEQRRYYDSQLRAVEAWAGFGPGASGAQRRFRSNSQVFDSLNRLGVVPVEEDLEVDGTAYIEQCRAQAVPIPPDWGDARWQLQGTLDSRYTFAGDPTNITQIWTYTDPTVDGACIALPRRDQATREIKLLGIICQSATTGAACFWDNIDLVTGVQLTGAAAERFRIDSVKNGSNLGENCTNCHRGYNVFVMHPGTTLDLAVSHSIDPAVRYSPVSGQPTWGNPGPLINAGTRPCAACHEIPELGNDNNTSPAMPSSYCGILRQVVDTTMPSIASPAGWATPQARYAAHVDFLRTRCSEE